MKKTILLLATAISLMGILEGCKKSIGNGSSNGGGTTSPNDTTKMLAAPYYLTCNINGVAKRFVADPVCVLDTVTGPLGGTYVFIGKIGFGGTMKFITSNVVDSTETLGINLQYDSFKTTPGGNLSYFIRTYDTSKNHLSIAIGQGIKEVYYPQPYIYYYIAPDTTATSNLSVTVTSIDAIAVKGTFNGVLTKSSVIGTAPATVPISEKITNGAFYMPYTK